MTDGDQMQARNQRRLAEMAGPDSAFMTAVGLELTLRSPTRVEGHIDAGARHHQPFGLVHGGVYCAAIEEAASIGATLAVLDRDLVAVGVHNATDFVRSHVEGRLDLVAVPVLQSRTSQLWQVDITRARDGQLVARGSVRLAHVAPR